MKGADKLRVKFRITEEQTALHPPDGMAVYDDKRGMRVEGNLDVAPGITIWIHLDVGKESLLVEYNPSRLVSATGGLCEFARLPEANDRMLQLVDRELGAFVLPQHRPSGVVQRLDIARDWVVDAGVPVLEQLIPLKRAHSTRLEQHRDPKSFTTTGLVVGGKENHAKLYLRQGAHPEHPDKEWIRFEITAREDWLKSQLFRTPRTTGRIVFADLTVENCERLLANRWRWSKFGTAHLAGDDWWQKAGRLIPSTTQMRGFCAYVFALQHGQDLGYKRDMVTEFSRWLDVLGAPPAPGQRATGSSQRLTLTHDTPRQLPVARARSMPGRV